MTALMISTSANYHWVRSISAHTNGGGVLTLTLRGDRDAESTQYNQCDICIFTDDVALTERLIAAINGVNTERAAEIAAAEAAAAEEADDEPANEYVRASQVEGV